MLAELTRRSTELLAERLSDWTDDEVGQLIGLMTRLRASFGDCRSSQHRPHRPLPLPAHVPADVPVSEPPRGPPREQTTRTPAQAT